MNEFTDKNEQAFLDACGAIGVEPNAMVNTQKERYLVSEFLKTPVSWLEAESLYHSYTTRGEAKDVAHGIDRMISWAHQWARASSFLDQSIQASYRIQNSGPEPGGYKTFWQSM